MRLILSVSAAAKVVPFDQSVHKVPKGTSSKVSLLRAATEDDGDQDYVFVATEDGTNVLGAVTVRIFNRKLSAIHHIGSIKSGIGTLLVKFVIDLLKKRNTKELILEAYENTGADIFYKKLGFTQDLDTKGKPSMNFRMKLSSAVESTVRYKLVKSLPKVILYHGTSEPDAKKGLRNDDNFNTDFMHFFEIKPIHLTDSMRVAEAYATSGITRKVFQKQADGVANLEKLILKKYGVNPNLRFGYPPNTKDTTSKENYSVAVKEFNVRMKELEQDFEQTRGKNGFIIQVEFTPKNILVFDQPFNMTGGYGFLLELAAVLKKEKGKFSSILFPNSDLKPENAKGKYPKSNYYLALNPKELTNMKVLKLRAAT